MGEEAIEEAEDIMSILSYSTDDCTVSSKLKFYKDIYQGRFEGFIWLGGWLFRILLCFLLFVCVLYIQMADLEKEILRRGRAYQCLLCDRYQGEKRHVIPHIYKYHIPLDSASFYCSLCHFIATEKKKS